jgi:hypothetical protein
MATIYEVARNLKMPGVQVQAHLDPTTLTTRVFNSARKMIASGRVNGWGASARVARHVLNSQDVPYIGEDKWGIRIHGYIDLSEADKAECLELYQAHIMVRKAQDQAQYSNYWDGKLGILTRTLEHTDKYNYIQCDMAEFREQLSTIILRNRYSVDRHKAQQVLTAFETGQPFPVNIFQ